MLRKWGWLLIPTFAFFVAAREGLHTTPDSLLYLEAAQNLAAGNGLRLNNEPYVSSWAPLFPVILSLGLGHEGLYTWLLHFIAYLGGLILWIKIGSEVLPSAYARYFSVLLVTSTPILMIFVFLWSEGVFFLLVAGYAFLLWRYSASGDKKMLWLAALAGCLLFLQRNAAFFMLLGLLPSLLWYIWCRRPQHLAAGLIHVAVVAAGGGLWNLYNIFLKQNEAVVGVLYRQFTPWDNLVMVMGELSQLFFPFVSLDMQLAGMVLMGVCFGIFGWSIYQKHTPFFLKICYATLTAYVMAWIVTPAYPDDISRLHAPVLPFFYLLFVYSAFFILDDPRFSSSWIRLSGLGLLLFPVIRLLQNTLSWAGFW